ncbi:MAG: molybdopterin-dependent oxidoreductase [Chloroflexi bacterium]|nr:molybdopterin-dependent oxidoreductase [Chloroflexota bacterium]
MPTLNFTVNGRPAEVEVSEKEYLSDVLRYRLGLTGTKIGCNEAECGTCTVLVIGTPIESCIYPALRAEGAEVLTVEGLASTWQRANGDSKSPEHADSPWAGLHPLQEAFVRGGAAQCGFCIPGILMTAKALIDQNPDPSEHDIKVALKDTYCRCGGYTFITNAIQAAARTVRTGEALPEGLYPLPETKPPMNVVGRPLPRPDGLGKVTGEAKYTDDFEFPGMLHARTLRAKYPHAILKQIDTSRAKAFAGVHAVLTHEDVPGRNAHGLLKPDWPVLCAVGDKVRYVGDAVAIVAAETREIATQALDLIEVEYEQLPVVSDPVEASQPDAPKVYEGGNLVAHIVVRKGDVAEGFAEADVVVEQNYRTATTEHAFLEPECAIGRPLEGGRVEVLVGSQQPYTDRNDVSKALGLPADRVRIRGALIGGAFGGKEDIAGQIHVAMLALVTGRPVKMLYDRHESLLFHPKRIAIAIRNKVGAKKDGALTAVETELYGNAGAYAPLSEKVMQRSTVHSCGAYEAPHEKADGYAVHTNYPPSTAFRGFGVTQSTFAIESTLDTLAETLGIDPIELRRNNAMRVGTVTNTGQLLRESVGLVECIDRVDAYLRQHAPERFASCTSPDAPHKRRAWGIAVAYKNTGLGSGAPDKSSAEVEVMDDGTAEVRTSATDLGQGLMGVVKTIAAEELGMLYEQVRALLPDTDVTPDSGPTNASRQTYVTGNAVRLASRTLREAMTATLAEKFDQAPENIRFEAGLVHVNGHSLPMEQVVEIMKREGREPKALYEYWAPKTQPLGTGGDMHFGYSYGVQAAQVEVDLQTGEVQVLRMVVANDIGRAINPLALQAQIEGGMVMGLGNALTEEFIVEEGQVFTDVLARYKMPSIRHTPQITSFIVEDGTADGPYGAKGVGEISSIPTTPAITNAIYNACGVRVTRLPVDQDRLLLAMRSGSKVY